LLKTNLDIIRVVGVAKRKNCKCKTCVCGKRCNCGHPCCVECNLIDFRETYDLLYAIDNKIIDYTEGVVCENDWGYSCTYLSKSDYTKLSVLKRAIRRHYDAQKDSYKPCLNNCEIQSLVEKAKDIVDITCCSTSHRSDIEIDTVNKDMWVLTNPGCVAFENWERCLYCVTPKYKPTNIEAKNLFALKSISLPDDERFKIAYNIQVTQIAKSTKTYDSALGRYQVEGPCFTFNYSVKEIEKCKSNLRISTKQINECLDLGISIKEIEDCKNQYDILVNRLDCDLEFHKFVKLLTCGFTPTIISNLINCGVFVSYSDKENSPYIEFKDGKAILTNELPLDKDNIIEIFSKDIKCEIDLDTLIQEYKEPDPIKKNLTNG